MLSSSKQELNALILQIFRANGALLTAGDGLVRDIELTSARWQVLGAVAKSEGEATMADIARSMGLSRQAVRRIVNDLAAGGLLELIANPRHRRARLIALTPAGRAAHEAADRRQEPWAEALAEGFEPGELAVARMVLERLTERVG